MTSTTGELTMPFKRSKLFCELIIGAFPFQSDVAHAIGILEKLCSFVLENICIRKYCLTFPGKQLYLIGSPAFLDSVSMYFEFSDAVNPGSYDLAGELKNALLVVIKIESVFYALMMVATLVNHGSCHIHARDTLYEQIQYKKCCNIYFRSCPLKRKVG